MSPNISAPDRNASSVVLTGRLPTSSISLSTRGILCSLPDPTTHPDPDVPTHRARVEGLLTEAADEHEALLAVLTPGLQASLPVDAQGITRAIDHLAAAAGLTEDERRALIRPHAVNPAVMHARVFGRAPLARETVIGSFVDGARVRADALVGLADAVGGAALGAEIRALLADHPPPVTAAGGDVVPVLRATYAAQERAAVAIAAALDGPCHTR